MFASQSRVGDAEAVERSRERGNYGKTARVLLSNQREAGNMPLLFYFHTSSGWE